MKTKNSDKITKTKPVEIFKAVSERGFLDPWTAEYLTLEAYSYQIGSIKNETGLMYGSLDATFSLSDGNNGVTLYFQDYSKDGKDVESALSRARELRDAVETFVDHLEKAAEASRIVRKMKE